MSQRRRRYVKKTPVVAVQVNLKTTGFKYEKWGGVQTCKPGDWLLDNGGDVYTVDREAFARTYRSVSPGLYMKVTSVWAEKAEEGGSVRTLEGVTHYEAGDYLVSNDPEGKDRYAVSATKFEAMYRLEG